MTKKRICIIDCGSNKTRDIHRIAQNTNHVIDTWYLFYPSINFKLDIDTESLKEMTLVKIVDDKFITSSFDLNFTSKYNSLIFSGGGLIESIQKKILRFFSHLKEIKIPTLGICFGHQIIGLVYGSEVIKLKEKVSGNEKVSIVNPNDLFHSKSDSHYFIQNHIEAISLPENFILTANSDTCENEMMSHKTKAIYGVQFHPEVSGNIGQQLIKNFLNLQCK